MPQCVRPGCEDLSPPENGVLNYELKGALARFTCNGDLEVSGGFRTGVPVYKKSGVLTTRLSMLSINCSIIWML